jgi:hypothetical protein
MPVVVVRRPVRPEGPSVRSVADALGWLEDVLQAG